MIKKIIFMPTLRLSWTVNERNKASIHHAGIMLYRDGKLKKLIPYHMIKEIQFED